MQSSSINAICRQLIAEAESIIKYTDDDEMVKDIDKKTANLFEEIRIDEMEHIQKLCIQLTELLTPDESEVESKQ